MRDVSLIIRELMHYKKVNKKVDFAEMLGISKGLLASWEGRNSLNIAKIKAVMPEISEYWLLTGRGEMIESGDFMEDFQYDTTFEEEDNRVQFDDSGVPAPSATPDNAIKLWRDVEVSGGALTLFDDTLSNATTPMVIPSFNDCTDAVTLYGDSMYPLIKSGDMVLLREWKEEYIEFGSAYLIVTKSGNRMVKYVRTSEKEGYVRCVSENHHYEPFDVKRDDILRMFAVKGIISRIIF